MELQLATHDYHNSILLISVLILLSSTFAQATTRSSIIEDYCYDSLHVICNNYTLSDSLANGGCVPQTFTSILITPPQRGLYNIHFDSKFSSNDLLNSVTFTSFSLCHSEAVKLTINTLKCGQRCSVVPITTFSDAIQIQCNENFPTRLNNLTFILFELNDTAADIIADCMNMIKYRFAIIDIRGMSNQVFCTCC